MDNINHRHKIKLGTYDITDQQKATLDTMKARTRGMEWVDDRAVLLGLLDQALARVRQDLSEEDMDE